jgi:hypothetical protein
MLDPTRITNGKFALRERTARRTPRCASHRIVRDDAQTKGLHFDVN